MSEIIIEWSLDGIRFLDADASGRVNRLGTLTLNEHHDPNFTVQELGEKISKWMAEHQFAGGEATLILPRETVVVRQLQLPQSPEDELPDLVRFQSAAKSSLPIDDLALDYLPLHSDGAGQAVLTTSIDRRRLARIQQILNAANFNVTGVTITPLGVGQFVKQFGGASLGRTQPEMAIFQRGSLVELSIFDRGTLVFSHSMVLPEANRLKPLESGLTRSIVALNQTHPNVSIERCFLVGASEDREVQDFVESRFPGKVDHVDLNSSLANGHQTTGFEPLIGSALPFSGDQLRLDLINPRKKVEKPDRRKLYTIIGGSAAALLLVLGYSMFSSKKSTLEASIDGYNDSIRKARATLKAGEDQDEAFKQIDRWSMGQAEGVLAWNQLREQISSTERLYFKSLTLLPVNAEDVSVTFIGSGNAKESNDVQSLYQRLRDNGFSVKPKTSSTQSSDPDYPIAFDLDVDLLRPKPEEKDKKVAESSEEQQQPQS